MHTAGIIYATPPATQYPIATVRSIVVMEQELAMMSALVMIALRHGTPIPVTDAHVLTLHLSKDQAPAQLHLPLKPSLNWQRAEIKQVSSLVLQLQVQLSLIAVTMLTGLPVASMSVSNHTVIPAITSVYMEMSQLVLITPLWDTPLAIWDISQHVPLHTLQDTLLLCTCKEATILQVATLLIPSMML